MQIRASPCKSVVKESMSKVNVFITVDTEHSIGGAFRDPNLKPVGNDRRIFGRIGDKEYGIPLIMDIADRYGIPLTFFVEVLNKYYFGEEESRKVCKYIIDRGHDVQLHLHPNYLNFTLPDPTKRQFLDQMFSYPLERQIELIEDGKQTLIRHGIPSPIAFRAGNFGADRNTLRALAQSGFLVDASYSRTLLGTGCKLTDFDLADVAFIENIWEFPVTSFFEMSCGGGGRLRPLDVNGISFAEMRKVLDQAPGNGPRNITILMHSFSFINPLGVQYQKVQLRKVVIRRFEKLCCYLAQNSHKFRVMSFGDLNTELLAEMGGKSSHHLPKLGPFLAIARKIEHTWDAFPGRKALSS